MYSDSQLFASSQGASQPFEAPAKRARQEEKSTCLPVTARWIEHALEQQRKEGSEELCFHGMVPGMLTMVGVVEELNAQPMSLDFTLNDGTGRLRARYFVSDPRPEGFSQIVAGRYVCLVGEMRTAPAVHFGCNTVKVVASADEVSYHLIEVAHTQLRLQKGALYAPKQAESAVQAAPVKATVTPVRASNTELKGALGGVELRTAILDFMRNQQENGVGPEGVALSALTAHLTSAPAAEIRQCIDTLETDGEIFRTMDDEHFSVV